MDAIKRKRLYELPEYRVLDAKRRKLISFHLLDAVAFSRACTMLTLNKTREAKRSDIKACLASYNRAQDPYGQGQVEEHVRRLEECVYGRKSEPDANFAGQVFELNPRSFLYKELGIRELPAHPTPMTVDQRARYAEYVEQYVSVVRSESSWQCSCRPDATQNAGGYLCSFCGRDNPTTAAKRARDPYS
jgi:hypothetical protein